MKTLLGTTLGVMSVTACHRADNVKVAPVTPSLLAPNPEQVTPIVNGQEIRKRSSLSRSVVAIVSERNEGQALCTGTLITQDAVLTAAHCVDEDPHSIRIGFSNDLKSGGGQIFRDVIRFSQHPKWKTHPDTGLGDVAILMFAGGIPDGFEVATLAPKSFALDLGTQVFFLGYGVTNGTTHEGAGVLRETTSQVTELISSTQVQTDGQQASVCFGDSGGPAFVFWNRQWVQWGIASSVLTESCNSASVHTTVMSYVTWMNRTLDKMRAEHSLSQNTPIGFISSPEE
jgi:hypothetical protein